MNFQESLDYLLSLGFELSVKKFGLENTTVLLNALGDPQKNFTKVQIAGTNGKGSTCAFLEEMCVREGIPVGVNMSPHLISIAERIRIDGDDISEKDFARLATHVRKVSEELVAQKTLQALPTYFEHVTAIAQLAFLENEVKIAILETGLGGRFDATTATNAEIVAFTPIDLDHTKTLGSTIAEIADEKAAIIRTDTGVVSVVQKPEAEQVIIARCKQHRVKPLWAKPNIAEQKHGVSRFSTDIGNYQALLGLAGKFQRTNAGLAIYLAELLREYGNNISRSSIEEGLEAVKHPGRLERSGEFLFDGAHNASGAEALAEFLVEAHLQDLVIIYGTMQGKNLEKVAASLFPFAEHLILATPKNPRAMPAQEIAPVAEQHVPKDKIIVAETLYKAINTARELSGHVSPDRDTAAISEISGEPYDSEKQPILVTGSLYLIGEIKALLRDVEVQRRKRRD